MNIPLGVGITRSSDFVQSKENTSVPNSFNVKLELSLFDQFKLKGAKIWTQTFLLLYIIILKVSIWEPDN
jgi:hypothetical protein